MLRNPKTRIRLHKIPGSGVCLTEHFRASLQYTTTIEEHYEITVIRCRDHFLWVGLYVLRS